MPTYAEARATLDDHRESAFKAWLCPRDGSLVLIFSQGGAVQVSISDDGSLTLRNLEADALRDIATIERTEGRELQEVLRHLERAQPR